MNTSNSQTESSDDSAKNSDEKVTVPTNPGPAIFAGLLILVITFGGFGTWSVMAELQSAVIASGTVKVSGSRKKVQHLEGGIVQEILVRNGDQVKEGQVLLRLDPTRAKATFGIVNGQYLEALASVARLKAERDDLAEINFPSALLEQAEKSEAVAEIIRGQKAVFEARKQSRSGQVSMVSERINQLKEEIVGLEAQVQARTRQIGLIADELESLQELHRKGYAPKTRILELQRALADIEGEKGENIASIAQARRTISEAQLEILQVIKQYKEQVVSEMRERQTSMNDMAERLQAAGFSLDRMEVVAPNDGTILGLQVHATGQVVRPGETILEIVPDDEDLIIEAKVRPVDIDSVQTGYKATVQFTAFSQRSTPRVTGEVDYKDADSQMDERTGMPYFNVNVHVSEEEVQRLGEAQKIAPGMPADVFIQTGSRTPFDYLTRPIWDSMTRAWTEDG